MVIRFEKEEIAFLKELLSEQQQAIGVLEFVSTVTEMYKELEYPLTNFNDFIKKLSKREGLIKKLSKQEISIGKEVLKIERLKRSIPAYYFPISNNEDFEDKATELYSKSTSQFNLNMRNYYQVPKEQQIPPEQIPPLPDELRNNPSKEDVA